MARGSARNVACSADTRVKAFFIECVSAESAFLCDQQKSCRKDNVGIDVGIGKRCGDRRHLCQLFHGAPCPAGRP